MAEHFKKETALMLFAIVLSYNISILVKAVL